MDERELVSLNDGRGTRINLQTGFESALDLTLVSKTLSGNSKWEVWTVTTVGSDSCTVSGRLWSKG